MYGAANTVYNLKKFPLKGPLPNSFKVMNESLRIEMDSDFKFNPRTTNSGFFYCCIEHGVTNE